MLLGELAAASAEIASTGSRLGKIQRLASVLSGLDPDEVPIAVAFLAGRLPNGTIGVGWAALRDLPPPAPPPASMTLRLTQDALERIRNAVGRGSQEVRRRELRDLFARLGPEEHRFLAGLLMGELRQGALEGLMLEAVAKAAALPSSVIRRATMVAGDLGVVAAAALANGSDGVSAFGLTVLQPVRPMLARSAASLDDAIQRINPASVEWKLDGTRIQAHRSGGDVRIFTRNLADVTARVPEIVRIIRGLSVDVVVLDGEAIALRHDGRPRAFQVTMSRFGTHEGENSHRHVPLTAFFFDCLHLDGEDLVDRPLSQRLERLEAIVPASFRVARGGVRSSASAMEILEDALRRGHEGVMVKAPDGRYEAGRRGSTWLKVKRARTLDLVVLAAEWGHGRRRGWLSNLHLGARDQDTGEFVMLGKTFKGMTDRMLAWQTERLLELEVSRDRFTVHVRPELVVEVAFDGVQTSNRYPGGMALRFARIKGYRPDKRPHEADTVQTVRAIHGYA